MIALAVAAVVLLASGFAAGYKVSNSFCNSAKLKQVKQHQKAQAKWEELYREQEQALVEAKSKREVVTREVIKKIPVYVDRDNCRITPDGVRDINQALSGDISK